MGIASHWNGFDPGTGAQPISEGRCAPQVKRIREATAPHVGQSTAQESSVRVQYPRRADHRANIQSIAEAKAPQYQGAVQSATGAKNRAQSRWVGFTHWWCMSLGNREHHWAGPELDWTPEFVIKATGFAMPDFRPRDAGVPDRHGEYRQAPPGLQDPGTDHMRSVKAASGP
jgi:hypothetical protein